MTSQPTNHYPPNHISSTQGVCNILQITDLHLYLEESHYEINQASCCNKFEKLLQKALSESIDYNLILVTGDLVSKIDSRIYDYIFNRLIQTNIPFACVAGNHDVTQEVGEEHIPFFERELVAHQPDSRLLNQHVIETEHWQILLLDSTDPGKVSGILNPEDLHWLQVQLTNNKKPALIAFHHHIVSMQSAWLDGHVLKNADKFWEVISNFEHVKAVTFGHVHQDFSEKINNIDIYATPSTNYQFKPKQTKFGIDTKAQPGYRLLSLNADGTHSSAVKRVNMD